MVTRVEVSSPRCLHCEFPILPDQASREVHGTQRSYRPYSGRASGARDYVRGLAHMDCGTVPARLAIYRERQRKFFAEECPEIPSAQRDALVASIKCVPSNVMPFIEPSEAT